eukprot:3716919-Rhodomonas_salina.4
MRSSTAQYRAAHSRIGKDSTALVAPLRPLIGPYALVPAAVCTARAPGTTESASIPESWYRFHCVSTGICVSLLLEIAQRRSVLDIA